VCIDFFQLADQQQEREHRLGTVVIVPRYVQGIEDEVENITPRPLPGDCRDEEHILDLIREFRRHFPYRQTIQWSIEYGNDNEHCFHILVKSPRSKDHH